MGGNLCRRQNTQINYPVDVNDPNLPAGNIDPKEIPDDQYLCPKCWRIPEILNIHSDNGHIVLKCTYHGIFDLSIKDYCETMKNNLFSHLYTKCFKCHKNKISDKKNNLKYCYECKVDFCEDCINDYHQEKKKEHQRPHINSVIPINEKNHKCLEHYNSEIKSFCLDCEDNVCEKEKDSKHKTHKIISFDTLIQDSNKYINIIREKNKNLADIIRFNNIIIHSYINFPDNYFHIKSLINVAKTIDEENKRDSRVIECMINRLEKSYKAQKEAIKSLQNEFNIDLTGNEKKLSLRNRKLGDKGLKLISKIIFKNLKEIDVSENNIINIESLNEMNLPHLEYLNMSYNQIANIKPIAELNAKQLKEISLQNNKIQDIEPFLKSDFPALERLRIENNGFNRADNSFKKLNNKFKNKVVYEEKTYEQFQKVYKVELNNQTENLDLGSLKVGDKLLQDLYLTIKPDNKIKHLKLDNNEIEDVSLLSRIPLNKLQLLDLSLNHIKNVKFLLEMKLPNLKTLYLNCNEIYNIYPLIRKFDKDEEKEKKNRLDLNILSLNENYLNKDDKKSKEMMKLIKSEGIETDLDFENPENNK